MTGSSRGPWFTNRPWSGVTTQVCNRPPHRCIECCTRTSQSPASRPNGRPGMPAQGAGEALLAEVLERAAGPAAPR